jgi:hypothetical protein
MQGDAGEQQEDNTEYKTWKSPEVKALDNIANAVHDEASREENAENNGHIIARNSVNEQKRANTISWWAFGISCLVFIATFLLFLWNIKGINAAVKAADAATKAAEVSQNSYEFAKKSSVEESIRNTRNFDMYEKSLLRMFYDDSVKTANYNKFLIKGISEQESFIAEQKEEFVKMHEPFLLPSYIMPEVDIHKMVINYRIQNVSQTPIQIINRRLDFFVDKSVFEVDTKATFSGLTRSDLSVKNRYISFLEPFEGKYEFYLTSSDTLSIKKAVDSLNHFLYYVYFADEINYINLITGEKRSCRYIMKVQPRRPELGDKQPIECLYLKNEDFARVPNQ